MNLSENGLLNRDEWLSKGYKLFSFDRDAVKEETKKNPEWIHFGAGNIFRAFQAALLQELLDKGYEKTGLIAVEGFDYEIVDKMYKPHDNLGLVVTLKGDGSIEKSIVGSIVESYALDCGRNAEYERLKEIFSAPSLKMASFTITEKGYSLVKGNGDLMDSVKEDFEAGPKSPISYIGKVAALLYERFLAGALPIAMVSMDNCSHNGDKLYAAIEAFAKAWEEKGLIEKGFEAYVNDSSKVSFPWSMIDKITPRPDKSVEKILNDDGIEELEPVITSKNTYVAPFVNAEESQYLVIEDAFPNGKISLDKAGVIYTQKETVDKVEKMKVCTCLNPLHTALAVFGCLLGFTKISDEMKDADLKKLVEIIGYEEGLKVVVNPGVLDPKQFIDEVVTKRIPNPFMPDTPQRIATDTSQKIPIRFGETIKAYQKREDLNTSDLKQIPLVFAAWLRYLMGINDEGEEFEQSSDPLLSTLCPYVKDIKLGDTDIHEKVKPILSDARIFAVDLYEVGLGEKVEEYFIKMLEKKGAIRQTLKENI